MTFLAIDIGNTRLKWACYEKARPGARLLAHDAEFLEQIDSLSEKAWKDLPQPTSMLGCVVAGDVLRHRVEEQLELWPDLQPRWVVPRSQTAGLINGYDIPGRLGVDRWVYMIGTRQHMLQATAGAAPAPAGGSHGRHGSNNRSHRRTARQILGGFILPGHSMMLHALEAGTAGLHHLPTGQVVPFPANTSDALTSGGTYALAGAVQLHGCHLREHCGEPPMCLMTGGAGWKLAPYMDTPFELVESLIFDGLLALAAEQGLLISPAVSWLTPTPGIQRILILETLSCWMDSARS